MMTLISSSAKGQGQNMDVEPRSLGNFGILEDIEIDDRFTKVSIFNHF